MANSTPRRRSARLSNKPAASPRSNARKSSLYNAHLGSLLERDETPEAGEARSIDNIMATPATEASLREKILQLTSLKTPTTEPQPSRAEMHPKTIHQTTTKKPDSGLKLGFGDISARKALQDTPSRLEVRQSLPQTLTSPNFEFKFASESHLSNDAQTLMENVREEAARIKAQMQAEKEAQDKKDCDAEQSFDGVSATSRKIAHPKGRAGRFSDVHMAQFKKMDSIANHASAFRAKSGFAQPTQQSLKRSGSRAGLDEPERPRTAGKGTPGRLPPPFVASTSTVSPFKSTTSSQPHSDRLENGSPAKRMRHSEFNDLSTSRPQENGIQSPAKTSTIPRPISGSLLSPTKASLARIAAPKPSVNLPEKPSLLPRSQSVKSLTAAFEAARPAVESRKPAPTTSPFKLPRSDSSKSFRPLPPLPKPSETSRPETGPFSTDRSQSTKSLASLPKTGGFTSRLPTFAGLKSILRSSRPASTKRATVVEKADTPKRPNTANAAVDSTKKVDFTPSVKSRYAVKLAAHSPSPAKHIPVDTPKLTIPHDPAEYETEEDEDEENWEDAESEVEYPTLPPQSPEAGSVDHCFSAKAKQQSRRESKEFKSIFTTLHHPSRSNQPSTLTSVNTIVNKTNPADHAGTVLQSPGNPSSFKQSPSIRRVQTSDVTALVQPFEDTIKSVPHGLPAKKRRHESAINDDKFGSNEDSKENRRITAVSQVPVGWGDTTVGKDEGEKRAGKRIRTAISEEPSAKKAEIKKPSAAREAAAKSAKDRKGKGILSMSRLNMLSRPKQRN